jgi:hypothetical protein
LRAAGYGGAAYLVGDVCDLNRLLAIFVDALHDASGRLRLKRLVGLRESEPGDQEPDREVSHTLYS